MRHISRQKLLSGLLLLLGLVGLASTLPWFARADGGSPENLAQKNQRQRPQSQCPSCPPPSPRRIYAPAIALREADRCEIVLNSRSPNVVEITPTFYTEDGNAVVGRPVQLQPAEIRFIPVQQLLPSPVRGRHRWGGIALAYTGNVLEVWAQLTFHGVGGIGSIDETFNILEEPGSDTREAVWWMPGKSTAIIALGNSSDIAIHATAQFSDGVSEEIDIAPYATRFLRRRSHDREEKESHNESVRLSTIGPEGSLRVAGFVISEDQDFAGSIRFHDTKRTVQPSLYATNFRLKNTKPQMVLKNTSDIPVSARPRFLPAGGEQGNPIELATVTLAPWQTIAVDLSSLREAVASRTDFDSVSVQVLTSGAPGSLIGAAYTTDQESQLTYDVPLRDSGKMRNATGSYPWRVDDDYSTIAVITNIGNEPARFQVEIRHPGGPYSIKPRQLAAGETATFDLRKIRDEQQPDRLGKTLPRDLDRGQFHWSLSASPGEPRIIGRAEVVSRRAGIVSSYSCPTCCPDSGPYGGFDPNAYTLYVNGFAATNSRGEYYDCYGNWYSSGLWWNSLWTNTTSIATITYSTEQLYGTGAGETDVVGQYDFVEWSTDGMDCYRWYRLDEQASAPVEVLSPTLGGPSSVNRAASATFTITNAGNGQISGWQFTDGTNTVTRATGTGNTTWTGVMVRSGTVSVTVTKNGQTFPLSKSITVNPRTGFGFSAVSPAKVANGSNNGNGGTITVPNPPVPSQEIGRFYLRQNLNYQTASIADGGPNQNFKYVTSVSPTSSGGATTAYLYVIAPDLENTSSTFYLKQCGNYNAQSNPNGFISGANLLAGTVRHESGATNSHYRNYSVAQALPSNNLGVVGEMQTGTPSESFNAFNTRVGNTLGAKQSAILQAALVEPCAVNYSATCVLQGYVNYSPYQSCP